MKRKIQREDIFDPTAILVFAGFVATVLVANWLVTHVGTQRSGGLHTIPVGFGMQAPSGVMAIGLSLTLRDLIQRLRGIGWALTAIITGSILSAAISPQIALASGSSFLFAELADLAVYTPMRKRRLTVAVIASNVVGAVVDSVIFLLVASGVMSLAPFLIPLVIAKFEWSLLAIPLIWMLRARRAEAVR